MSTTYFASGIVAKASKYDGPKVMLLGIPAFSSPGGILIGSGWEGSYWASSRDEPPTRILGAALVFDVIALSRFFEKVFGLLGVPEKLLVQGCEVADCYIPK